MKNPETVHLAIVKENQYEWIAIGKSRSEAIKAIKRAYYEVPKSDRPFHPDTGSIMTFDFWIEWHGICIHELTIGSCQFL